MLPMRGLVDWANRHHEAIRDARRQYRLPG